ncbi:hypothetical protein EVAR_43812_1 [Eumeta japonica]|uniref:Uncharacterized protein n=1 Tax=Eumeta variegata TaxID=151549 RepID=A0A4C1WYW6_EUMVA|nr:hypothetical protein EVAR_43812_1 [Eumeta japonica]
MSKSNNPRKRRPSARVVQYNTLKSAAVKLDTKASQWRKVCTRRRRKKGRGELNPRITSFAGNSERRSFVLGSAGPRAASRSWMTFDSHASPLNLLLPWSCFASVRHGKALAQVEVEVEVSWQKTAGGTRARTGPHVRRRCGRALLLWVWREVLKKIASTAASFVPQRDVCVSRSWGDTPSPRCCLARGACVDKKAIALLCPILVHVDCFVNSRRRFIESDFVYAGVTVWVSAPPPVQLLSSHQKRDRTLRLLVFTSPPLGLAPCSVTVFCEHYFEHYVYDDLRCLASACTSHTPPTDYVPR